MDVNRLMVPDQNGFSDPTSYQRQDHSVVDAVEHDPSSSATQVDGISSSETVSSRTSKTLPWSEKNSPHEVNVSPGKKVKVTSYRVRKGSISPTAQARFEERWPHYGCALSDFEATWGPLVASQVPLVCEVGPGTGISTLDLAAQEPHVHTIAAEVYEPGLMKIVDGIVDRNLSNLHLVYGDATVMLEEYIPDERLAGIRVFFPDPWPKKRHHKRRFLQEETFTMMARKLAPSGLLHIATDHAGYAEWIEEILATLTSLTVVQNPPEGAISVQRPVTKFEKRGLKLGHSIRDYYLVRA